MAAPLSFDQAPPISVPYRFFLTAPLFQMLAGALLLVEGDALLASRWTPGALALTHLFTVGFMLQAMLGALMQFIPVVAGGNLWRPRLIAGVAHPLLTLAALLLATAFLSGAPLAFRLAGGLFALAAGVLLPAIGMALARRLPPTPTLQALRLSTSGLAVTVLLGLGLLHSLHSGSAWPLPLLTDIHLGWGLGVWGLGLLAGASYVVVPMFQLTPPYPKALSRLLLPGLLLAAVLGSLPLLPPLLPHDLSAATPQLALLAGIGQFLALALAAVFAGSTLILQGRRRRRVADPGLLFFRLGMLALLSAIAACLASQPVLAGALLAGLFLSVISGMLYRIIPFLNCLHLQTTLRPGTPPPTVGQMLEESAMRRHLWLHLAACLSLAAAAAGLPLTRLAGVLLLLAGGLLWRNLGLAVLRYQRRKQALPSA